MKTFSGRSVGWTVGRLVGRSDGQSVMVTLLTHRPNRGKFRVDGLLGWNEILLDGFWDVYPLNFHPLGTAFFLKDAPRRGASSYNPPGPPYWEKAKMSKQLIVLGLLKFVQNSPIKPFKTWYYCPIIISTVFEWSFRKGPATPPLLEVRKLPLPMKANSKNPYWEKRAKMSKTTQPIIFVWTINRVFCHKFTIYVHEFTSGHSHVAS